MRKDNTPYRIAYAKEHYKRVALDMKKDEYAALKDAADSCAESVGTFIKTAVSQRIEREALSEKTGSDESTY